MHSSDDIHDFFARSDWLDRFVLRPLSHIASNWEMHWDLHEGRYEPEPLSFADDLNKTIDLIAKCARPFRYHDHEDIIIEEAIRRSNWPIQKKGRRWIVADYASILERASFHDLDQQNLIAAASGRVHAALDRQQKHFDQMEESHCQILAALLSIIIYHRYCNGSSLLSNPG